MRIRACHNSAVFVLSQFFHTGHAKDNKALVEMLRHQGVIKSQRVMETMEGIDRKLFAPQGIHSPYVDSPLPIGHNATISAPHMHALCLQLLDGHLYPGARALDVGSGIRLFLWSCFIALPFHPTGDCVFDLFFARASPSLGHLVIANFLYLCRYWIFDCLFCSHGGGARPCRGCRAYTRTRGKLHRECSEKQSSPFTGIWEVVLACWRYIFDQMGFHSYVLEVQVEDFLNPRRHAKKIILNFFKWCLLYEDVDQLVSMGVCMCYIV